MKLLKVIPSTRKGKKYVAYFKIDDKREVVTHFGQADARDYVLMSNPSSKFYIKDIKERNKVKAAYITRHAKEDQTDPTKPATLSRFISWSIPSFAGAIRNFKKKFNV